MFITLDLAGPLDECLMFYSRSTFGPYQLLKGMCVSKSSSTSTSQSLVVVLRRLVCACFSLASEINAGAI